MKDAIIELHEKLLKAGLTDSEADALAARFLEEEAEMYCECMNLVKEKIKEKKVLLS